MEDHVIWVLVGDYEIWVRVEGHAVWTLVEVVTAADLDVEIEVHLDNAVIEMNSKKKLTLSRRLKGAVVVDVGMAEVMRDRSAPGTTRAMRKGMAMEDLTVMTMVMSTTLQ